MQIEFNYAKRNYLEKRLIFLRKEINSLGKFGYNVEYYLDHLDEIVKEARRISTVLTSEQMELKI